MRLTDQGTPLRRRESEPDRCEHDKLVALRTQGRARDIVALAGELNNELPHEELYMRAGGRVCSSSPGRV